MGTTCINRWLSNAMFTPGAPIPINKHDPGVQRAARFGVYRYNNMSNDIFLFKESHINKATLQVVRGLKYKVNADIDRTVCRKRMHPNLDTCDFQRNKILKQVKIFLLFLSPNFVCSGIFCTIHSGGFS
nr:cystatin-F isoform X1 [Pogona vitticeps]